MVWKHQRNSRRSNGREEGRREGVGEDWLLAPHIWRTCKWASDGSARWNYGNCSCLACPCRIFEGPSKEFTSRAPSGLVHNSMQLKALRAAIIYPDKTLKDLNQGLICIRFSHSSGLSGCQFIYSFSNSQLKSTSCPSPQIHSSLSVPVVILEHEGVWRVSGAIWSTMGFNFTIHSPFPLKLFTSFPSKTPPPLVSLPLLSLDAAGWILFLGYLTDRCRKA